MISIDPNGDYTKEQFQILGLLAVAPESVQEQFVSCKDKIEAILKEFPEAGLIAFSFIGAGLQAKY